MPSHIDLSGPHTSVLAGGLAAVQRAVAEQEQATALQRGFMTMLVPGLLQTEDYIHAVLGDVIDVYGGPGDLDEGVAERLNRQRVLAEPGHTFHYVLLEQLLWTVIGGREVMAWQPDRLTEPARGAVPSCRLGVIPRGTVWTARTPNKAYQFNTYDDGQVSLELAHTYLVVTDPAYVALHIQGFERASRLAVYGEQAASVIKDVRAHL